MLVQHRFPFLRVPVPFVYPETVKPERAGRLSFRGISWATKDKVQQANYFGSLTQASTIRVGSYNGEEIYAPFKSLLPMVI